MGDVVSNPHLATALRGERTTLRPPTFEEVAFVRALWEDPATMEAVGGVLPLPAEKARKWFEYMIDPGGVENCYLLIFDENDAPVGEVSFHQFNPRTRVAELNIKVMARHRGRGLAKDALAMFLDFYFNTVEGNVITDAIRPGNAGAPRLLTGAGFELVATRADRIEYQLTRARHLSAR